MWWIFTISNSNTSVKAFAKFNYFCYNNGTILGWSHLVSGGVSVNRQSYVESAELQLFRNTEPGLLRTGGILESYLFTWVLDGHLHCVADGRDSLLTSGTLMICEPGQWQMHYADIEHTPTFVSVFMQLHDLDLSLLTGRIITPDSTVVDLLASAMEEAQRPDTHSESMILNLLELVLYRLLRAHRGMMPAEKPTAENRIIRRAQQYIDTHVCEKLSVPTVAQMTGVSPSYLTALFHKHLHFSPGEYIRIIKLQKSKQLIREGKMNFTEIADFLSYSTVHHFSRQFKENFGISPTEYVKSLAKSAPDS